MNVWFGCYTSTGFLTLVVDVVEEIICSVSRGRKIPGQPFSIIGFEADSEAELRNLAFSAIPPYISHGQEATSHSSAAWRIAGRTALIDGDIMFP